MGKQMKNEFSEIFKQGGWKSGKGKTVSGAGSTLEYTANIRNELPDLFKSLNIKTVIDAPCGDYNWFHKMEIGEIIYFGFDIVDGLIEQNMKLYGTDRVKFSILDVVSEPLPTADLMLCRDLLRHIKLDYGRKVLENFVRSGTKYLLTTTYVNPKNVDIAGAVGSRRINLLASPFNLPEPQLKIADYVEGFAERYLGLWDRKQIEAAMRPSSL